MAGKKNKGMSYYGIGDSKILGERQFGGEGKNTMPAFWGGHYLTDWFIRVAR